MGIAGERTEGDLRQLGSELRRLTLPAPLTSFVGRRRELDAVRLQLLLPEVRLLTLTGPTGTGKTRLAIQAASELRDAFEDGVHFVDLAPISDPSLVASAISQALGIHEEREPTTDAGLKAVLRGARSLLVLDNFEQVVAAAPVVAELLATCPALKVMVTSRFVLRVAAEHQFQVPSLGAPATLRHLPLAELARDEAVVLFVQRAQAVDMNFRLTEDNAAAVAEICARLDGLPLAIELAAARGKLFAPQALLARLSSRLGLLTGGPHDLPARQQTLRGAIDLSHDLLDQNEQALFRRLAVFVGGFTLEVVEAIADSSDGADGSVLDGVAALVDKNMLRREPQRDGEPRFWMLETIREYALERLLATGELENVQRRHALLFLWQAQAAKSALVGPDQAAWLARLDQEHDNLRAALRWCVQSEEAEIGLQMSGALWRFWHVRGYQAEGRGWLARLLALPTASAPTATRASALHAAGKMACDQGDDLAAQALVEECLAIRRTLHDQRGIARALVSLARIARDQGDGARARLLLEQARPLIEAQGGGLEDAVSSLNLGRIAHDQGDCVRSRALYEQSLAGFAAVGQDHRTRSEASGHLRGIVSALSELGEVEVSQGQYGEARSHLEESWRIALQLGDRLSGSSVLERAAGLFAAQGAGHRALRLAGAAAALRVAIESQPSMAERAMLERRLEPAHRMLGEEAAASAYAEGRALAPEQIFAGAFVWAGPNHARVNTAEPRPAGQLDRLTSRERQVALLIASGLTNREIAAALVITRGTAANHVEHVLKKLGCKSRTQIAAWVVEHELHGGAVKLTPDRAHGGPA